MGQGSAEQAGQWLCLCVCVRVPPAPRRHGVCAAFPAEYLDWRGYMCGKMVQGESKVKVKGLTGSSTS